MMLTIVLVGTIAMILLFSIYLREDVKFSVRFWGTGMSLEVKDQHVGHTRTVGQESSPPAGTAGETTDTPPWSE